MPDELTGQPRAAGARRLPLLDVADLDEQQRALHGKIAGGPRAREQGRVPVTDEHDRLLGPFGIMLLAPQVGDAVQALGAALRFETRISVRCRELGILTVAAQLRSEFEWTAHERAARAAGVSQAQLQALLDGEPPPGLDPVEALAVSTCRALAARRPLSDADYGHAVEVFGAAGLAELVWLVGYYGALALALEVFNPPLSQAPSAT